MNSLNDLIQSHDMYDDFDTSFTDTTPSNIPQQPPFIQQITDVPIQPEPVQPIFREATPPPAPNQFVAPFPPQQQRPRANVDHMALQNMIMEIQDIERRLHVLFHSCQRLLQYNQPPTFPPTMMHTPQPSYPQPLPNKQSMYQSQQVPVQPPIVPEPMTPPPQPLGIKEGVFNGEHMISADGETYKVPPAFACSSKLIEGDFMKAQLFSNGQVKFKQAEPSERENIMGILSTHAANTPYYIVQTASKAYKVLTEAVQMNNGSPGCQVLLIVPQGGESEWAAIETIYRAA